MNCVKLAHNSVILNIKSGRNAIRSVILRIVISYIVSVAGVEQIGVGCIYISNQTTLYFYNLVFNWL